MDQSMFPCHIYGVRNEEIAPASLPCQLIKDYGDRVALSNGKVLHWNFNWDDGGRRLVRCRECGALFLIQCSELHSVSVVSDGYYSDWIPVATEEGADLLNIALDETEIENDPRRHLRANNLRFFWTDGEVPCPEDPEWLKRCIRKRYAKINPSEVEELIRQAGK